MCTQINQNLHPKSCELYLRLKHDLYYTRVLLCHQKCPCSQLSSPLSMRIVMFSRVSQKSRVNKPIQLRYKLELGLRTV